MRKRLVVYAYDGIEWVSVSTNKKRLAKKWANKAEKRGYLSFYKRRGWCA